MVNNFYAYYGSCVKCGAEWHIETNNDYGKKHSLPCGMCNHYERIPTIDLLLVASGINNDDMNYSYTVRGPGAHKQSDNKWVYAYHGWCSHCEANMIIYTTKNYGMEHFIMCPYCIEWGHGVDLNKSGRSKNNPDKNYTVSVRGPGAREKALTSNQLEDRRN